MPSPGETATCKGCGKVITRRASGWEDSSSIPACIKGSASLTGPGPVMHEPLPAQLADPARYLPTMGYFTDHLGELVGPWPLQPFPVGMDPAGAWNHRLLTPQPGQLIQAVSLCGHRAHVLASGDVDCPSCLTAMNESQEGTS